MPRLSKGYFNVQSPNIIRVIVIAREPGISGSKPTESEGVARGRDKVGLRCHKSMATRAITVIIISHLIGGAWSRS